MTEPGRGAGSQPAASPLLATLALNRRQFLASAGAFSAGALKAASPALAIAHCKAPSNAPESIPEEARRLTRAAIGALGGMGRFVSKGNVVWVKPNIAWDRRPEQAACTNPDVVAAIVEMCFQAGAAKVVVSDNPCHPPERTFPRSGIQQAAEKAGARCPIMDERKFRTMSLTGAKILTKWPLYSELVQADCLINVPIAKQHSLARATLGMKNLMGAAGGDRNRFHQDIANTVTDLAAFLKPRLVVLDAVRILTANGPTGGNLSDVKRKDLVAAGVDQIAVDSLGATILGYRPADIPYLAEGQSRRLGTMDFRSLAPVQLEV